MRIPVEVVEQAERYAEVVEAGGVPFDEARAVAIGAEPAVAHEVAVAVAQLHVDGIVAAACSGRTGVRTYSSWWQGTVTVYMFNSCQANGIKAALAAGGALLTLVLALSGIGVPVAPIAAAAAAIGVAAIGWCTRNGTGLQIHDAYYGAWCTNQ